jgi:hypothetical protein
LAYIVGFMAMVVLLGWHPQPINKGAAPATEAPPAAVSPAPTSVGAPGYQ